MKPNSYENKMKPRGENKSPCCGSPNLKVIDREIYSNRKEVTKRCENCKTVITEVEKR